MIQHKRLPQWLRNKHRMSQLRSMKAGLRRQGLNTVCEEARCPNMAECFSRPTATFLILGAQCTRGCSFCSIESSAMSSGVLSAPDPEEPMRVVRAAKEMGLKYVVVTSVTRDDLDDGGASVFASTVRGLKESIPGVRVEVLVPDFRGDTKALGTVMASEPDVLNHNIETVPSLYASVRPEASYERSLGLLRAATGQSEAKTKSGLMLGLGEKMDEVMATIGDLREVGCDMLTIGQYMRPRRANIPVVDYILPDVFDKLRDSARKMGFTHVASAPLVRSSMNAAEFFSLNEFVK